MFYFNIFLCLVCIVTGLNADNDLNSAWHWICVGTTCKKEIINLNNPSTSLLSHAECRILCWDTIIWPKPTGKLYISKKLSEISIKKITLKEMKSASRGAALFKKAFEIFLNIKINEFAKLDKSDRVVPLRIITNIKNLSHTRLTLDTDESYSLDMNETSTEIKVTINASTFFGARHALETLGQLIIFDDLRDRVLIPNNVSIKDKPAYKWRGLGVDTSRNYIDIATIKRTLKAMSASKLNTLHWHLVDSQSFPYVSKSRPEMAKLGAYNPKKVYSNDAIKEVIEYARVRGIRVVPELDAPAHVGEGWQNTGTVRCFNYQPWWLFCSEPPCGQISPIYPEVYDILEDLYGDILEQFGTDFFHMGGDEVNINCWNSSKSIVKYMQNEKGWDLEKADFLRLWALFQNQAYSRLKRKAGKKIKAIIWTSDLVDSPIFRNDASNKKYIIQVWNFADSPEFQNLLKNNFTLILSNYHALYLDCGYSSWTSSGNNWCSPYKGWQTMYENKPGKMAGNKTYLILGGEAEMWTEQARSTSIDSKVWPRAAALGEVFWTEPANSWREAERRMLLHTERLVALGVNADALEPEWCAQNEQMCRS